MISFEPSRFRSPLLEPLPPVPPGRDPRRLRRRRLLAFLAAIAFGIAVAAAGSRRFSDEGPAFVLYWLHDRIFLPLKGHLFTWLYPVSWVYLLAGSTLLLFGAVAWWWKRPLTPSWQVLVGRRLLFRPSLRPVLRLWARGFRSVRRLLRNPAFLSGSTLLEELVENEREGSLARLDGLVPAAGESMPAIAEAVDLALFSNRLTPPCGPSDRATWEAVLRLDEALVRLDLVRTARTGDPEPSLEEFRGRLEAEISSLVGPLLAARPRRPDFSLSSLGSELAWVLELEVLENCRDRVLEGVETRRRLLDESRRRLERWTAYARHRLGGPAMEEARAPAGPVAARLALDVALFAALRLDAPRAALAFLESLEGLRFALLAAGQIDGDAEESETEALLEALGGLPRPVDYRICAFLLGREASRAEDVNEALARRSSVLSPADLRLIVDRAEDLRTAAADSG